jgi:kinetochore protein Nuf2
VFQQLANAEEKLERTRRQAADRQAASAQTLARLQREYAELSAERRENDREVDTLNKEADEIERRMGVHLHQSEDELNELLGVYWELRLQTRE